MVGIVRDGERGSADQRVAIIEQGDVNPVAMGTPSILMPKWRSFLRTASSMKAQTRIVQEKAAMYRYVVSEGLLWVDSFQNEYCWVGAPVTHSGGRGLSNQQMLNDSNRGRQNCRHDDR